MKEWKIQPISKEWTLRYLEGDCETWVLEHMKCDGAISFDHKVKECMSCKKKLDQKDIVTIQLVLKKDRIKM